MDPLSKEEIRRHVRIYISVFAALAALTVITVAISTLDLSMFQAISIALSIATVKGALVALFFMHLISEKQIIFSILALTAIFVAALLFLPAFAG